MLLSSLGFVTYRNGKNTGGRKTIRIVFADLKYAERYGCFDLILRVRCGVANSTKVAQGPLSGLFKS